VPARLWPSPCDEPPNCSAVDPAIGGAAGIGGAAEAEGATAIDRASADAISPGASRRTEREERVSMNTPIHDRDLDGGSYLVQFRPGAQTPVHHREPGSVAGDHRAV